MDRTRTSLRLATALIAIALAAPAAASATDYCVNDTACVSGGGTAEGTDGAGLKAALDAAAAHTNAGGPDRVLVGPGTYFRAGGAAPAFAATGDALILEGAGPSTILTRDAINSSGVLSVGADTVARHLAVAIPGASSMVGVFVNGTTEDVSVSSPLGSATGASGVKIADGGTFAGGTLAVPGGTGASMLAGSTLTDARITAGYGVQASGAAVRVLRSRITATNNGILSYYAALDVQDTLFDLDGLSAVGIVAVANVNGDATTALRHVTIVNGSDDASGLTLSATNGKSSTAVMRDSIISGVGHPATLLADGASAIAALSTSYSSYPADGIVEAGSGGAATPAAPATTNLLGAVPGFVDAANGDWHLRFDSPLVDAGTPGPLGADESTTDADGLPRLGGVARDPGAFEVQPPTPVSVLPAGDPPAGPAAPGPVAPISATRPPAPRGASKPVLSALAFSPRAFRAGTGAHLGTRLTYRLSAAATVTLRVERTATGHRSGRACTAHGKGKPCTRYVLLAGKVSQKGAKGTNSLRFTGRLGKTMLKPGAYRVVAQPAGGAAVRAAFTVEKAKKG